MQEKTITQLILFENIATDPIILKADALFLRFLSNQSFTTSPTSPSDYYFIQKYMLTTMDNAEVKANYWKNYVCRMIGSSDNVFSHMAEKGVFDDISQDATIDTLYKIEDPSKKTILELALEEIKIVRKIYNYDYAALAKAIESETKIKTGTENIACIEVSPERPSRRQHIHDAFLKLEDWDTLKDLLKYYRSHGAGYFESYDAFTWDGEFIGVKHPDPITMDDLVGYETQKNQLVMNTEFLIRDLPCNNVLLYGDSGTGKSSSIKALLNRYKNNGLKLIALPKERIEDLPKIYSEINGRGLKFIIFIDDLSFEDNENSYKSFKSIIEGNIYSGSSNSIICVTSNRRNIIKEVWKDRNTSDDVHLRDNIQETKSLSDRFGLTIIFTAPDKKNYLEIVKNLAENAGIKLDNDELSAQALTWEVRHGGRSGRTAKQFIDHITGMVELNKQLNEE